MKLMNGDAFRSSPSPSLQRKEPHAAMLVDESDAELVVWKGLAVWNGLDGLSSKSA